MKRIIKTSSSTGVSLQYYPLGQVCLASAVSKSRKTCFILVIFLCLTNVVSGQNFEIEGRVINKKTTDPIPYANLYNKSLEKGTISNADGYFRIPISGGKDSVRITVIGFKEHFINLQDNMAFYLVHLEESVHLLDEVTVTPKDNSYLFDLIKECRKSTKSKVTINSKAYYELKSFRDNFQIELVEGYYNLDISGYKLTDLHLKAGRVALRPFEDHFFASLVSSKSIIMLDLLNRNEYFPKNPLELTKSKLKKSYYLTLDNKYIEGSADSVFVIDYHPKENTGMFFKGKLWINKTKKQIMKITLNCDTAGVHPFLPLFQSDIISNVTFNISQTFKTKDDQTTFKHIDFVYKIDYVSRAGETEEQNYAVKTNAILYAYDYSRSFFQPTFNFDDPAIGDYRKINALPYNDFFWSHHDEYRMNDSINANERFFSSINTLTNKSLFGSNDFSKYGLFEHPYVEWSKSRIGFRELLPDAQEKQRSTNFRSQQYNLAVQIYLDLNSYRDSTHIVTSTIFDPYESYYYLPIDNQTHCFVNMYFDLCEIQRRKLQEKLLVEKENTVRVKEIYDTFLAEFETEREEFLKAVQRGTDEGEMRRYNDFIYQELGIDNIELFQPFNSEE